MNKICFCEECIHLRPTEKEQDETNPSHICLFYKERVLHKLFHPEIVRLDICLKECKKEVSNE